MQIGRLSPSSNIYGISSNGRLVVLWDEADVAVHSVPLTDLGPNVMGIRAVGGVDNGYARGIFAVNNNDIVYNVYWDGKWKKREIPLDYGHSSTSVSVWFGNFNDRTFILYGHQPDALCDSCDAWYSLYRLDFTGGEDRYDPVRISHGVVPYLERSKLCKSESPSLSPSISTMPSLSSYPSITPTEEPSFIPSGTPTTLRVRIEYYIIVNPHSLIYSHFYYSNLYMSSQLEQLNFVLNSTTLRILKDLLLVQAITKTLVSSIALILGLMTTQSIHFLMTDSYT